MYKIVKQDELDGYLSNQKKAFINIHIAISHTNLSKTELLGCIGDAISTSSDIQVYIHTINNLSLLKRIEEIMSSVLVQYHNLSVVIINNYENGFRKNISDIIYSIDSNTGVKNSIQTVVLGTETHPVLMLGKTDIEYIISKYNDCSNLIENGFDAIDLVKYCNHKYYSTIHNELDNILLEDSIKFRPNLKLKILYVDQAEKEIAYHHLVSNILKLNENILKHFNTILETEVDTISIFKSSIKVEELIKNITKDKSKDIIFIVLDTVNRTATVNPNNNSYYIPIDLYITPGIINSILNIIIKNIYA